MGSSFHAAAARPRCVRCGEAPFSSSRSGARFSRPFRASRYCARSFSSMASRVSYSRLRGRGGMPAQRVGGDAAAARWSNPRSRPRNRAGCPGPSCPNSPLRPGSRRSGRRCRAAHRCIGGNNRGRFSSMPMTSWICGSVCSMKFFGDPPPRMKTMTCQPARILPHKRWPRFG